MALFIAIATVLVLGSIGVTSAFGASTKSSKQDAKPFEGTFIGEITGDKNSHAPLKIDLNQEGNNVSGILNLGSGLYVDGGHCGGGYIPATIQFAEGQVNGRNIDGDTTIKIAGIKVTIELDGQLSSDGETIEAEAKVNLPWFCGGDPVVEAALIKEV